MNNIKELKGFLRNTGHETLMEIQEKSIIEFKKHDHVLLYSKTGSGKTLAFLLAMLSKIDSHKQGIQGIVIAPSRELAVQINDVFRSLKTGFKSTLCYGGHSMKEEENSLSETPVILIGTPGRIADHIDRDNVHLEYASFLAIDEFDKCLELGFNDEMKFIISYMDNIKNTMLVSATRMEEVPSYIDQTNSTTIDELSEDETINIKEYAVNYRGDLVHNLSNMVMSFNNEHSIVFCNFREVAEDIANQLNERGITCVSYHGGLEQDQRDRALIKFRNGSAPTLICTDLGSRGLDIPEVNHIIHYQYPNSKEAFTHRKGRTARMAADGNSYLFIGENTQLPDYIDLPENEFRIPKENELYLSPDWITLYLSGGKKDKINKIDIVGFLSQKGKLGKNELGLIIVQDRISFAAVKRDKHKEVLKHIRNEKIKGKKLKIEVAM